MGSKGKSPAIQRRGKGHRESLSNRPRSYYACNLTWREGWCEEGLFHQFGRLLWKTGCTTIAFYGPVLGFR